MYLDMIEGAFARIVVLEFEVARLKEKLSRKPKPVASAQVQLTLEFDIPFLKNGYTLKQEEIERRKKE